MMLTQKFFDSVRESLFGGKLSQAKVSGMDAIGEAFSIAGHTDKRWLAYILATVYHETGLFIKVEDNRVFVRTMQPVEEMGKGKNRVYGSRVKYSGKPYSNTPNIFYGRGHTQNTWYEIYEQIGKKFGVDTINHPELLLDNKFSAKVSVWAMVSGIYTGKRLSQYFNAETNDPVNARRIINGKDKAELIASYYEKFLTALT